MINGHDEIAVFLGLDVGTSGHHAVAQDRSGKKLLDRASVQGQRQVRLGFAGRGHGGRGPS